MSRSRGIAMEGKMTSPAGAVRRPSRSLPALALAVGIVLGVVGGFLVIGSSSNDIGELLRLRGRVVKLMGGTYPNPSTVCLLIESGAGDFGPGAMDSCFEAPGQLENPPKVGQTVTVVIADMRSAGGDVFTAPGVGLVWVGNYTDPKPR